MTGKGGTVNMTVVMPKLNKRFACDLMCLSRELDSMQFNAGEHEKSSSIESDNI